LHVSDCEIYLSRTASTRAMWINSPIFLPLAPVDIA
jgi:hypothetical protein